MVQRTSFVLGRQMGRPVATGAPRCNWNFPVGTVDSGRTGKLNIPELGMLRELKNDMIA